MKKREDNFKVWWDTIEGPNIHIIAAQKDKRKQSFFKEKFFKEIMTKNLGKKTDIQIQEVQKVPKTMSLARPHEYIIIKLSKLKDKETQKHQEKSTLL